MYLSIRTDIELSGVAAALGVALITGFFGWLARKGDRDAAEQQRQTDAAARRDERHTADMAQWRDVSADVLGRAREFMTDVHPHGVTINYQHGTAQQVVETLNTNWEALREPLARLAVGHPSVRARELADDVISGRHGRSTR
jgi:sugar phosphate isomerase/epimerase